MSAMEDKSAQEGKAEESEPGYTMRTYYMGFLKRGPKWSPEATEENMRISEGHMAHIVRMAEEGKLILSGPFIHPPDAPQEGILAGIFLFDVETLEEAQALCDADPGVQSGRFVIELLQWYGPAGISYVGMK